MCARAACINSSLARAKAHPINTNPLEKDADVILTYMQCLFHSLAQQDVSHTVREHNHQHGYIRAKQILSTHNKIYKQIYRQIFSLF